MMAQYFSLIGNYVIKYCWKLPAPILKSAPFYFFLDVDNHDIFQKKFKRHFYGFIVFTLIVSFMNLQIFRRFCCKKVIVIRKKKRVD